MAAAVYDTMRRGLLWSLPHGVCYRRSVRWGELEEWCPSCRCPCAAC